jgi:hypothetical protein
MQSLAHGLGLVSDRVAIEFGRVDVVGLGEEARNGPGVRLRGKGTDGFCAVRLLELADVEVGLRYVEGNLGQKSGTPERSSRR